MNNDRRNNQKTGEECISEEFVAHLVHDLKSPVITIGGYSRRLLSGRFGSIDSDQKHALEIIVHNCSRLEQDLDNILEHFRSEKALETSYPRKKIEVGTLLLSIIEDFAVEAEDKGLDLKLDIPDTSLEIRANERLIDHAVANLVSNSIKYTPEGGHITVKAGLEGDTFMIQVKDTGKGFPQESVEQMFQPFEKVMGIKDRQLRGVGLGLSNVRRYVEALGGHIHVESQENRGSTFTILLHSHSDAP